MRVVPIVALLLLPGAVLAAPAGPPAAATAPPTLTDAQREQARLSSLAAYRTRPSSIEREWRSLQAKLLGGTIGCEDDGNGELTGRALKVATWAGMNEASPVVDAWSAALAFSTVVLDTAGCPSAAGLRPRMLDAQIATLSRIIDGSNAVDPLLEPEAYRVRARMLARSGRIEEAADDLDAAADLAVRLGLRDLQRQALTERAALPGVTRPSIARAVVESPPETITLRYQTPPASVADVEERVVSRINDDTMGRAPPVTTVHNRSSVKVHTGDGVTRFTTTPASTNDGEDLLGMPLFAKQAARRLSRAATTVAVGSDGAWQGYTIEGDSDAAIEDLLVGIAARAEGDDSPPVQIGAEAVDAAKAALEAEAMGHWWAVQGLWNGRTIEHGREYEQLHELMLPGASAPTTVRATFRWLSRKRCPTAVPTNDCVELLLDMVWLPQQLDPEGVMPAPEASDDALSTMWMRRQMRLTVEHATLRLHGFIERLGVTYERPETEIEVSGGPTYVTTVHAREVRLRWRSEP